MTAENYNVIGVMSGTSLDGVDIAHIRFNIADHKWSFEILESETVPYDDQWVQTLQQAVHFDGAVLSELNERYTELLAGQIASFIKRHRLKNIDAVCSHGHTILHQPTKGITLQIGNLPLIADLLHQKVVCNFRIHDVQLGGQGAPLVPIGDRLLFGDYDYCLNLGGFSNISFEDGGKRIAFDICAVNTVLNYYANQLGRAFDDEGKIAASGAVNRTLLEKLNTLEYYSKPFPKSLGFESVKEIILPLINSFEISIEDNISTFTEHIAEQIALALPQKSGKMLVTGGGAYNQFLISLLKQRLPEMSIIIPESKILEYKEALIFALLGVLKLRNETNVLSSVTGASHDHSSGFVYHP